LITEASIIEELFAVIPHGEICTGGRWVTCVPTMTISIYFSLKPSIKF